MARKKRQEEGGSLDSLLDTMTNVVGILVIVLIVTQLNVAEALKRIQSNLPQVTQEDVDQMKMVVDENRKSMAKLETTWTEVEPEKDVEKKQLDQLILEIEEKTVNNKEVVDKTSDLDDLKKKIKELQVKVDLEVADVTKADEELQTLKAMMDETPDREVLAPKIVHLPDPRPAPEGAEPRYVLCKGNKAYVVGDVYEHLFKVRDFIEDNFDKLVYRGPGMGSYTYTIPSIKKNDRGGADPVRDREERAFQKFRYDAKKLQDFFEKGKYGGNDLWYQVSRANPDSDYAVLKIACKPEGGQGVAAFKQRNSPLDLALKKVQGERNYVMFFVAPDSFDAYLEARQMAEFYNLPAGWQPWTTEEFTPSTRVPRETTTIELDDVPVAGYEAIARVVTPIVEQNRTEADNKLKTVTDPEAKPLAQAWVQKFASYESAVVSAPKVAASIRGTHQVLMNPNAPYLPHIRVFKPEGAIPTKKPAPAPPKPDTPKKEPVKPKRDTLD